MESCATLSNVERSSGLNSSSVAPRPITFGEAAGLSGGGDIALPAPTENKGATAALHHLPVDLRPEGDEIIQRRYQGQEHHEPDGQTGDPMYREEVRPVNRPFLPSMIEDHRDDRDDLHQHFEFAEFAGFNGEAFRSCNRSQAAHQKLAADDYDGDPRRNQAGIELHESDESRRNQKLVGQRVKQHSHGGDLAALAGQISVNTVRNRSCDEQRRCQQFLFASRTSKAIGGKDPNQQRDAEDAGKRDGIGKIHGNTGFRLGDEAKLEATELSSTTKRESNAGIIT